MLHGARLVVAPPGPLSLAELGALIRDGTPRVRIHGEELHVKARIRSLDVYSGHADREELVQWARPTFSALGSLLLVHGEPEAMQALGEAVQGAGMDPARLLTPRLDEAFGLVFEGDRWQARSEEHTSELQSH